LSIDGLAPHFVCVLRRPSRLDELHVRIEARSGVDPAEYERLAAALVTGIKDSVGVTTEVEVLDPGTLARSSGKIVRIVDER
jgi:phenylacetate-CoA ligase